MVRFSGLSSSPEIRGLIPALGFPARWIIIGTSHVQERASPEEALLSFV